MKYKTVLRVFLSLALLAMNQATADSIAKPHTFTAGAPAKASEVNDNFDAVYEQVNKISGVIDVGDGSGADVVFGPNDNGGNFRFLNKNDQGYHYLQAGTSSTDPAAKLRISRINTSENLDELRMSADNSIFDGKIGIGMSPHQDWAITIGGEQHPRIYLKSDNTGIDNEAAIAFGNYNGTEFFELGTDNDQSNAFHIGNQYFGEKYLTVTNNGRVGIGTQVPGSPLHVYDDDYTFIVVDAPEAYERGIRWAKDGGVTWSLYTEQSDSSDILRFRSHIGSITPISIRHNGNVGIGTTAPIGKLDVNGTIYQRGAELHADYVFEPDYLLESIEAHAEKMWREKHLPAVPKAQTDENGREILEVGAHRKGMLEELEKAHVYIEQLNDTIKKQQSLLAVQQERVSMQQNQISALTVLVCADHPQAEICVHEE
ncbi:MAG: hypothetical protein GY862_12905 [Gammaproteobacteria bacterium]|nr:hypothetical protein [Gammaproteobacteria bacterium]